MSYCFNYFRKSILCIVAVLLLGAGSPALLAKDKQPFSLEVFERLKSEGHVVLVDVYAEWCPTCRQQQKLIKAYVDSSPEIDLHILVVDFDKQKDIVTMLGAPRQSTLILYKGNERVWFSVAEVRPDVFVKKIEQAFAAIEKALDTDDGKSRL